MATWHKNVLILYDHTYFISKIGTYVFTTYWLLEDKMFKLICVWCTCRQHVQSTTEWYLWVSIEDIKGTMKQRGWASGEHRACRAVQWCELWTRRRARPTAEWLRLRKRTGPISSVAPTRQGQRFGGLLPLAAAAPAPAPAAVNVKILCCEHLNIEMLPAKVDLIATITHPTREHNNTCVQTRLNYIS